MDVDTLAQIIRKVDGSHKLGAGALAEAIIAELWQPIETAPKDGTCILVFRPAGHTKIVVGFWDSDAYAQKPRPYWSHDRKVMEGTLATRQRQPTHWMPLPPAPEAA